MADATMSTNSATPSPAETPEPMGTSKVRPYTLGEEIANSIIHGLGIALSISALTMLIVFSVQAGNSWALGAGIVYGISLVL